MLPQAEDRPPNCTHCGYSLKGLSASSISACPECGSTINWSRTYQPAQNPARQIALAATLLLALPIAIGAIALYDSSDFGLPSRWPLAITLIALLLASPLAAIAGLHLLLTMNAPTTAAKRTLAAIAGIVLGPMLSIIAWALCTAY